MAEIANLKIKDTTYEIKDKKAREMIENIETFNTNYDAESETLEFVNDKN